MKPAAVGLAKLAILRYPSGLKVAVWGTGSPGDCNGCLKLPKFPVTGDVRGFTKVPVGERGASNGLGPFGNSHWVDWVGKWI